MRLSMNRSAQDYVDYGKPKDTTRRFGPGIDSQAALADKWKPQFQLRVVVTSVLLRIDVGTELQCFQRPQSKYDKPKLEFGDMLETVKILRGSCRSFW